MSSSIRSVFDLLDPPIWVVTSSFDGRSGGFVATFVMKASIVEDEPRMIVGAARHHFTHQLIADSGQLALHLPAADDVDMVLHFGLRSGHHGEKFPWRNSTIGDTQPPALPSCVARLLARVETSFNIGDRTLFVCRITEGGVESAGPVMTVSELIPQLTDEQSSTLKTQLLQDAGLDRAAIRAWREQEGLEVQNADIQP